MYNHYYYYYYYIVIQTKQIMSHFVMRTGANGPLFLCWPRTAAAVRYAANLTYTIANKGKTGGSKSGDSQQVNQRIKKDEPKVVDTYDVEELGNKSVFCRCWKSKKFPYCDGAHGIHNKESGDNVGPLIIQRRGAQ